MTIFEFDRQIVHTSHEYQQGGEEKMGRIVDRYHLDLSSVAFNPSSYSSFRLHVHLNGDKIKVKDRSTVLIKVCYANIFEDLYEDNISKFPEIEVSWEGVSEGFPKLPMRIKSSGGFNDQGSQFSFLYKMLDSSNGFHFSGFKVGFNQQIAFSSFTVFRPIYAFLEVTSQTSSSIDPGRGSEVVSGKEWNNLNEILNEIITHEENFLKKLETLNQKFYQPLIKLTSGPKPLIKSEDMAKIFSNAEMIEKMQREFLSDLKKGAEELKPTLIGSIYLKIIPFLKPPYTHYCNSYPTAISLLEDLKNESSKLVEFLMEVKTVVGESLTSLLQAPIQHTSRSLMLIRELSQFIPEQERPILVEAHELLSETSEFLNNCVLRDYRMRKILEIQNHLIGLDEDLISPSRSYLFEGNLLKLSGTKLDKRWFFLFTDCIIYAKVKKNKVYEFKGKWDLSSCFCKDLEDSPNYRNAFYIIAPKKTYILIAKTSKSKKIWMDMINIQVNKLQDTNLIRRNTKRATFKEPKKGLLQEFKRELSSEDYDEAFYDANEQPRKDSYMNDFNKMITPVEQRISVDEKRNSQADGNRLSKLTNKLVELRNNDPETKKRISDYQSNRMSSMDFLLEAFASTDGDQRQSPIKEEEEEGPSNKGRSSIGGKLRQSYIEYSKEMDKRASQFVDPKKEKEKLKEKEKEKEKEKAKENENGEKEEALDEETREKYISYIEDLLVNNEDGANDNLLCKEPIDVSLEDGNVVTVGVLYSTDAQEFRDLVVEEMKKRNRVLGQPDPIPSEYRLFSKNDENGEEKVIRAEEYILATLLNWELPEKMSFVLRKVAVKVEEKANSIPMTAQRVRPTRHFVAREQLVTKPQQTL